MSKKQKQTDEISESSNLEVVRKILSGSEHVISHAGASQYARPGGGVSACGLAALNCARVVLGKEKDGLHDEALLRDIMSLETAREIMSICTQWSTEAHLEVEDICKVPIFTKYMTLVSTKYSRPGLKRFKTLLTELAVIDTSAAVIITRPPEIIACVKVAVHGEPLFLIFDSHPRPCHPTGAGFIFSTSIDYTANHLNDLLTVDRRLLTDDDMQWQAQLLANFSGHTFVRVRDSPADLTQAVLESSLAMLALRAEVADLKYRNSLLEENNKRLEAKIEEKERRAEIEQHRSLNLYGSPPRGPVQSSQSHLPWNRSYVNATIGFSDYVTPTHNASGTPSKTSTSVGSSHHPGVSAKSMPHYTGRSYSTQTAYTRSKGNQHVGGYPTSRPIASGSMQDSMDQDIALATKLDFEGQTSKILAMEKQREFEEEDRQLRKEREALASVTPAMFSCGICLEEQPEDYVARVDNCEHAFCRECLRNYIVSKVDQHRFPMLCPLCVTEERHQEPEVITNALVQQVGIEEKQYEIYEELQMASFGILLHCRQCKQSVFVDRQEYVESPLIVCPFPKCQHAWCKTCQHTITIAGPKHSCDGSSELKHLMKQQGWKHCPGCQTPIWKDAGCNHMTCMSPGCNAHFCYLCGKLIIQSGLARAVTTAVSEHFRQCSLFEVPT